MKTTAVVAIAFLSALTAFPADLGERLPQALSEALVKVIAKPQDFVGKPIRISGIFSWGFEDEKLFMTFDHFAMYDEASAVDLRLDETRSGIKGADLEAYRGFRVKLEGVLVEQTPRNEELELARKSGLTIKPRYYFLFSRLLSYGPASSK